MAGYTGSKPVLLSTTAATVSGNITASGSITGATGQFDTSLNVDGTANVDVLTQTNGAGTLTLKDLGGSSNEIEASGTLHIDYQGSNFQIINSTVPRLNISNNGDLSLYEDTGTTAKFFWDASAESLGIGTNSPQTKLSLGSSVDAQKLALYDAGNNVRYGFGIATDEFRMYYPSTVNGHISFGTIATIDGSTFSEKMRIDSSGNVGIGTNSPSANLDVASSNATIHLTDTDDTTYGEIRNNGGTFTIASDEGQSATNSSINFRVDASEVARIDSSGNVGIGTDSPLTGLYGTVGHISGTSGGLVLSSSVSTFGIGSVAGVLQFYDSTNATERMRIDSSGNLLVGAAATSINDYGAKFIKSSTVSTILAVHRQASDGNVAEWGRGGNSVGSISVTASATAYNTSSDYRLKEAVQPMTGASARVQVLNPVNFAWKVDGSRVDGFLAHELQTVVPEAVTGTKDAMKDEEYEVTPAVEATYDAEGVELTPAIPAVMGTRSVPDMQAIDQSKIVPLLTAALQEALTEIADLKTRVSALEGV